jgi:predicted porin
MKKKIIVAAIAAAVAAPMAAMADAVVYGKVRVATQYHDRDNCENCDAWGLVDQVSRLGIKGSEDLGNGLKAIYKMEFGVNVGDGVSNGSLSKNADGFWSQRNAYVGLAGDWGTFLAGRHDTPYKLSVGKLDFFADTAADNDTTSGGGTRGVGLFEGLRTDGALVYISPNWAGFNFSGAAIQSTARDEGNDDYDNFAHGYSLAAQWGNGPWFIGGGYENLNYDEILNNSALTDETKWRVGVGVLGFSNFSAAAQYEDRSDRRGVSGQDSQSWQLSLAYDFGNNRIKGMYGDFDDDSAGDTGDFDTWAVGLQHNLSKRTDVQVLYRQKNADSDVAVDDDVFALQLDHAF